MKKDYKFLIYNFPGSTPCIKHDIILKEQEAFKIYLKLIPYINIYIYIHTPKASHPCKIKFIEKMASNI